MNRTKIEWADVTWNPVTGCLHGCKYCYAEKIAKRFSRKGDEHCHDCSQPNDVRLHEQRYKGNGEFRYGFKPTFHPYRLREPAIKRKPSRIFVVSMGDLFGEWVPDEWIEAVFNACDKAQQHTYLFLTKNPGRYIELAAASKLPRASNFWYGTSITNQSEKMFGGGLKYNAFLSIEPLLGPVTISDHNLIWGTKWIIVGAQTGPGAKPPNPEWVQAIIDQARETRVPVFLKNNLHWPDEIRELPEVGR